MTRISILWPIVTGLSLIAGAWILGHYIYASRATQSYVTVKGLSEREVRADRASWTIIGNYGAASTEEAQTLIRQHETTVRQFLTERGFSDTEIKTDQINLTRNAYERAVDPYTVNVHVSVETDNVDLVQQSSAEISGLISRGILLSGDRWMAGPRYFYTDFQDIKTEMLAEATKNAEESAKEFAINSGSEVGKIKYANQGVFQILPASRNNDQSEFYADKLIRVVTTVDYFLE